MEGVVQIETGHCRSACRRRALEFARFPIDAEMLIPALLTRMEQRHFFAAEFIESNKPIALSHITSAASQTQVGLVIGADARLWDDMLHLEGEIEDGFGRPTVFTAMAGP